MSHSESGAPLNQNQQHVQDYLDSLLREPDIDAFLAHDLALEAGEKLDSELPGDNLHTVQDEPLEPVNDIELTSESSEGFSGAEVTEDVGLAEDVADKDEPVVILESEKTSVPGDIPVAECVDKPDSDKRLHDELLSPIQESDVEPAKVDIEVVDTYSLNPEVEPAVDIEADSDTLEGLNEFDFELSSPVSDNAELNDRSIELEAQANAFDIEDIAQALEEAVVAEDETEILSPSDNSSADDQVQSEHQSEISVGGQPPIEVELDDLALHGEHSGPEVELTLAQDQATSIDPEDSALELPTDSDGGLTSTKDEVSAEPGDKGEAPVSDVELRSVPNECAVDEQLGTVVDTVAEIGVVGPEAEYSEKEGLDTISSEVELSGAEYLQPIADTNVQNSEASEALNSSAEPTVATNVAIDDKHEVSEPEVHAAPESTEVAASLPVGAAPSWVGVELNCVVVQVHGISIAIPMDHIESATSLENVSLSMDLAHDWILGQIVRGDHTITYVLDSASWMMPELYDPAKADYQDLIMLQGGYWGIACDEMVRSIRIPVDKVAWAVNRAKRPWLLGTYMAERCAILDVDALVDQLNAAF